MTEKEKMLEELNAVKEIIHRYNSISPSATEEKLTILKGLLQGNKETFMKTIYLT